MWQNEGIVKCTKKSEDNFYRSESSETSFSGLTDNGSDFPVPAVDDLLAVNFQNGFSL